MKESGAKPRSDTGSLRISRRLRPGLALALGALVVVGVVPLAFWAGTLFRSAALAPPTTEAEIIAHGINCRLVERHTVEYIEKPAAAASNTGEVQRLPARLRNFSDLGELEQWLVAVAATTTTVYFQTPEAPVDCDDYALAWQSRALADGYILSFAVISRSEYSAVFGRELPPGRGLHAINLAVIGNYAYYIEPQTGEIALAAQLD